MHIFTWSSNKVGGAFVSQIEKFKKITGQLPHHIDSHYGVHMHPKIKLVVMRFAEENNIPVRSCSGVKFEMGFYERSLRHWNDSENATDIKLVSVLKSLSPGDHEIMCHPGYVDDELKATKTIYLQQREAEAKALTGVSVREFVDDNENIVLIIWYVKNN